MNKKRILIVLLIVILVVFGGIVYWLSSSYGATPDAIATLTSTDLINYKESNLLAFEPIPNNGTTGIIFYPGGKVDPKAYAPLARDLAAKGYTTVIVTMPLNLAVLNINGGDQVIEKYPNIKNWIVAGHSLGGSMAAKYANQSKNPKIKGIVFLAAYPDTADDLSKSDLKVLSLYGSLDNVLNKSTLESTKKLLPGSAVFTELSGGNHSQFGYYGLQAGDNAATLSLQQQQSQTVGDIDNFIKSFNL